MSIFVVWSVSAMNMPDIQLPLAQTKHNMTPNPESQTDFMAG